ncbi:hypothetical protein PoB_003118600 [Plakobranchus ocellatus]|uniref:Uncharacterized protein n=1 Tax=Plakobranchus ocellatus TaxID=259542 RepID=A0AAV4ADE9_9GAST|nr:hypothetical protein PoB_003118600 [Plakobranchus ocellatus]
MTYMYGLSVFHDLWPHPNKDQISGNGCEGGEGALYERPIFGSFVWTSIQQSKEEKEEEKWLLAGTELGTGVEGSSRSHESTNALSVEQAVESRQHVWGAGLIAVGVISFSRWTELSLTTWSRLSKAHEDTECAPRARKFIAAQRFRLVLGNSKASIPWSVESQCLKQRRLQRCKSVSASECVAYFNSAAHANTVSLLVYFPYVVFSLVYLCPQFIAAQRCRLVLGNSKASIPWSVESQSLKQRRLQRCKSVSASECVAYFNSASHAWPLQ